MNMNQVKGWIAQGELASVEGAWLEAISAKEDPQAMAPVLEALVAAGKLDSAETLGIMLLDERTDLEPKQQLDFAKAAALAVVDSGDLRDRAAKLYEKVYGGNPSFKAIFHAAGLLGRQSPRRALRTLDICLALSAGDYLASRFEGQVVRVGAFEPVTGQFDLTDAGGKMLQLEPKALADEFEPVDLRDFRVQCTHQPQEVKQLLQNDPEGALVGICMSRNGNISADDLKEFLTPRFLSKEEWSGWWSRARTAAKRSTQLTLEGRSPIMICYHPHGRTLEDEMAPAVEAAKTPLETQAVLQQYLREVRGRKLQINPDFAGRLLKSIADQAVEYHTRRPGDALTAALALEAASMLGLPVPAGFPSSAQIVAAAPRAAEMIASLEDAAMWPPALDAMVRRPDAAAQLEALIRLTPASLLDEVAGRLIAAGRQEAIAPVVSEAAANPEASLEVALWLWKGPAVAVANAPSKPELLNRLIKTVGELDRRWDADPVRRKEIYQKVRAALSASDFAVFRQAVSQMDEHVASTVKRQVERTDGLAESVQEGTLEILRDRFPGLFFSREKIAPWLDDVVIWTTEKALHRREAEFKELTNVKMLENARAIGAAAEHGDLSENSEWKFALEERDMLKNRSIKMQEELSRARILRPDEVPTDSIGIGSRVLLKREGDGLEKEVTFLGPWDIDLEHNILSYQTRLAQDLMGKAVGQSVELKIEGFEGTYRIERIGSALKK